MNKKIRFKKIYLLKFAILLHNEKASAQTFDYADGPLILAGLIIFLVLLTILGFYFSGKRIKLPSLRKHLRPDIKIKVKRINKELVITIYNHSKETQEIYAPTMHFTRGRQLKKLQPRNKFATYPLSLTPGTFHRFRLVPKQMKKQIADLKKFWYFTVVVFNSEGKKFVSRECRFR